MRAHLLIGLTLAVGCGEGLKDAEDCDPLAATSCEAGKICRVAVDGATQCLEPLAAQSPCVPGSCGVGEACLWVEGVLGCRTLCAISADACADESPCSYRLEGFDDIGICAPVCTLQTGCEAGVTCAPVGGQGLLCVAEGLGQIGEACTHQRCANGLACLDVSGRQQCRALCETSNDTPCPGLCTGRIANLAQARYCVPPP